MQILFFFYKFAYFFRYFKSPIRLFYFKNESPPSIDVLEFYYAFRILVKIKYWTYKNNKQKKTLVLNCSIEIDLNFGLKTEK